MSTPSQAEYESWRDDQLAALGIPNPSPADLLLSSTALARIKRAVAEERERCARIAEEYFGAVNPEGGDCSNIASMAGVSIAANIREGK